MPCYRIGVAPSPRTRPPASTRYYNQFWQPKLRLQTQWHRGHMWSLLETVRQTQNPREPTNRLDFGLAAARRARVAPFGHVGIDESAFLESHLLIINWLPFTQQCHTVQSIRNGGPTHHAGPHAYLIRGTARRGGRARAGRGAPPDGRASAGRDDAVPLRRVAGRLRDRRGPDPVRRGSGTRRGGRGSQARARGGVRSSARSLHRSETRPGRRRGVQSAPRSTCSAPWARTSRGAHTGRGAALDEERCPSGPGLAAVILLLGLVGLLASCFEAPASARPAPARHRRYRGGGGSRCVFPASLVVAVPGCGDARPGRGWLKKARLATCNTRAAKSCWFQDLVYA